MISWRDEHRRSADLAEDNRIRADRIRERLREVEAMPELGALAQAMQARVRELELEAWLSSGGPLQTGSRATASMRARGTAARESARG